MKASMCMRSTVDLEDVIVSVKLKSIILNVK